MEPCACSSTSTPVVCNALLGYVASAMHSSTSDNICKLVLSHYSSETVHEAKKLLWQHVDDAVVGAEKVRRGSTARPREDFEMEDVVVALRALDEAKAMPCIHVSFSQLRAMPRVHPEEMLSASVISRLGAMEDRMRILDANLAVVMDDNHAMKTRRDQMEDFQWRGLPGETPQPQYNPTLTSSMPVSTAASSYAQAPVEPGVTGHEENTWSAVLKKKRPAAKRVESQKRVREATKDMQTVVGSSTDTSIKGSGPIKVLFVHNLHKTSSADDVRGHLKSIGVEAVDIRPTFRETYTFASYKVTLQEKDFTKVFVASAWPEGARVREWLNVYQRDNQLPNNGL